MPDEVIEVPTSETTPIEPPKPLEIGDWIWPVYWRPFAMPGAPKNGTWETALTRVVSIGVKEVCHEVSNPGTAIEDASCQGSLLRWTLTERVFQKREAALDACRSLPAPN